VSCNFGYELYELYELGVMSYELGVMS